MCAVDRSSSCTGTRHHLGRYLLFELWKSFIEDRSSASVFSSVGSNGCGVHDRSILSCNIGQRGKDI
ncbi:hypothetical protein PILCRDRAFT_818500 [Piloderma croceum F 1598]|uniref:Uncharacterized protein n=1 Tax=Piloderma croceum (strain F 1598) TaxID=765440 RepID=A0A0C3BCY4_PILCF|nr:hypothetical protein PILCRDRAFT_818500 [Piloderma croceum F 1598]